MQFTEFHPHQLDNYARLALRPGGIYAAEPGTGKTLAAFTLPQLWARDRCKRVACYLTSYAALGTNGGDEWPDTKQGTPAVARLARKGITDPGFFTGIGQSRLVESSLLRVESLSAASGGCVSLNSQPSTLNYTYKCIGSPTLATALNCLGTVIDCTVADEAVKAKNADSYAGEALAAMQSAYRLALSGTPIKSNLPDVHALAEWVAGAADLDAWPEVFTVLLIAPEQLHEQFIETARTIFRTRVTILHRAADAFADPILSARMCRPALAQTPMPLSIQGRAKFEKTFLCTEINHTKALHENAKGRHRVFKSITHTITNHHQLHRTLAPFILRQRKADLGIPLVKHMKHTIQLPFGTTQYTQYRDCLRTDPGQRAADRKATVTALRQLAIMAPGSPASPKMQATLELIIQKMWDGKQGLVLSPFTEFSRALRDILATFDVPCMLLDGSVSPATRGRLAAQFKKGDIPVLIGGVRSMGTGSSFSNAQYLIRPGLEWAHDDDEQSQQRHDRIDSIADVDTYTLITTGSIDDRIAQRLATRAAAAASALGDTSLLTAGELDEAPLEGDILREVRDLRTDASQHESDIAERIRTHCGPRLRSALLRFREHHPAIVRASDGTRTTPAQVKAAVANLPKFTTEKTPAEQALARLKKLAAK